MKLAQALPMKILLIHGRKWSALSARNLACIQTIPGCWNAYIRLVWIVSTLVWILFSRIKEVVICWGKFCLCLMPYLFINVYNLTFIESASLACNVCRVISNSLIENPFLIESTQPNTDSHPQSNDNSRLANAKCTSCHDNLVATSWCVDCNDFLCDGCVQVTFKLYWRVSSSGKIIPILQC